MSKPPTDQAPLSAQVIEALARRAGLEIPEQDRDDLIAAADAVAAINARIRPPRSIYAEPAHTYGLENDRLGDTQASRPGTTTHRIPDGFSHATPAPVAEGYLTIAEASKAIRAGQLSPVELTRTCLDRIASLNDRLHAFVHVLEARALDEARAAEAAIKTNGPSGPLHGIPIGLKDIIDTAGVPTTACSRWFADNVPTTDAGCAERLRDAGTVLLGKLTTHELAVGGPSFDLPWPAARNPWGLDHYTQGSSSGTGAAVAAGMILGGLGTDTGGSIRGPAALCGIAGLKPTYGLVSRRGVAPAAYSLDHIGPLAWTSEDCAIMLNALAGHDPLDPASARVPPVDYAADLSRGAEGLRIGVIRHFHETDRVVSPATRAGIDAALRTYEGLGAQVRELTLSPLADWVACNTIISITERAAAYEELARADIGRFGQRVRDRILLSLHISGVDYVQALRRREELHQELLAAMVDVDVAITACQPAEAPRLDAVPRWDSLEAPSFTQPFNAAGFPAMSICSGFGEHGLPLAIQLVARPFEEAVLLRAGHAFEQATPHRGRRPAL